MDPVIERAEGVLEICDEAGDRIVMCNGDDDRFNWPMPRLEVRVNDDSEVVHLDRERVEALRDFCDEWLEAVTS
jgi:hypothetical protein